MFWEAQYPHAGAFFPNRTVPWHIACLWHSDRLSPAWSQCELAALVILASGNKVGKFVALFVLKAFEQAVFTVNSESLGCGREGYDFQIGKLGDNTPAGMFPRAVTRFPANSLNMSRIFPNFTMKLYISAIMVINGLVTTNLLNISNMCNFFIINVLQN